MYIYIYIYIASYIWLYIYKLGAVLSCFTISFQYPLLYALQMHADFLVRLFDVVVNI